MLSRLHIASRGVSFYNRPTVAVSKKVSSVNGGLQRYRLLTTTTESGSVKVDATKDTRDFLKIDATRAVIFTGGLLVAGFGFLSQMIVKSEERSERNMSRIEQGLKQDIAKIEQSITKMEKSIEKLRDVLIMNLINNKTPSSPQVPATQIELES